MTFRYTGFISYSQKDKLWAMRLHKALESYRLPSHVAGADKANRRLGRFFRDDEELAGAPSLGEALNTAIESSKCLIVVCSPNSARSKWVDAEIRQFKRQRRDGRVLAMIVEGRPDATDPEEQCFTPSLLYQLDEDGELTDIPTEPLAPDVRKENFSRVVTRIVAGLLDINFDELWRREQRRKTRNRIVAGAVSVVALIGGTVGLLRYQQAEQGRLVAEQEQLRSQSVELATLAQEALDAGRWEEALGLAVRALPTDLQQPDRPVVPAALSAFKRVMIGENAAEIVARYGEPVEDMHLLSTGHLAVRLASGRIEVFDPETGSRLDGFDGLPNAQRLTGSDNEYWISWGEREAPDATVQETQTLEILDRATGGLVARQTFTIDEWVLKEAISPDGRLIVATPSANGDKESGLAVFEVGTLGDNPSPVFTTETAMTTRSGGIYDFIGTDQVVFHPAFNSETDPEALYRWRLSDGEMATLSPPDAEDCGIGPEEADTRRVGYSVSVDRTQMSVSAVYERSVGATTACFARADLASGEEQPVVSFDSFGRLFLPVSQDLIVDQARAALVTPQDEVNRLADCKGRFDKGFRILATQPSWMIKPAEALSVCASGRDVVVHGGESYRPVTRLSGPNGEVTHVEADPEAHRVWAASEDNVVRMWTYALPGSEVDPAYDRLIADEGVVVAISSETEETLTFRRFTPAGEPTGPVVSHHRFTRDGEAGEEFASHSFHLLGSGKVMAVAEGFHCARMFCSIDEAPEDCCPVIPSYRVTYYALGTGHEMQTYRFEGRDVPSSVYGDQVQLIENGAKDRVVMVGSTRELRVIGLTEGETQRMIRLPDGEGYIAASWADGGWWIVTQAPSENFEAAPMRLYRDEGKEGGLEPVEAFEAHGLRLIPLPAVDGFFLEAEDSSQYEAPYTRFLYRPGMGLVRIELPESVDPKAEIRLVSGDPQGGVSLVFGDYGSYGPVLHVAPGSGLAQVANAAKVKMNEGVLLSEDEAPYRQTLLAGSQELGLLPLDPEAPLCPGLAGTEIADDTLAVAPNGRYLMVAVSPAGGRKYAQVYDLATCVPIYSSATPVDYDGFHFASADHVWLGGDGRLEIVDLEPDLGPLVVRARQILASWERLGGEAEAKSSTGPQEE